MRDQYIIFIMGPVHTWDKRPRSIWY